MSEVLDRIKEMHKEILEAQKKKKDLSQVIKDGFAQYTEYKDITEEMNKLRERRKQIELQVRQEYSSEYTQLEDISTDIKDSKTVLSDLIWNELMKNNTVEVTDEWENKYVPQVTVILKKER
ncbi:hypothetical protein KKC32_05005 [Patescibacteria group bacterium]|nr:hypothetical protein [Patescibacteria group bacterium]